MNKSVNNYFLNGCGRCPLGGTPECKVHSWNSELLLLRSFVRESELTEECKWGVPCYTYKNKNVLTISAFKEYCAISFFKGSLLKDDLEILVKPGKNSQSARLLKFKNIEEIKEIKQVIKEYISQAIKVEKVGSKVEFKKNPEPFPDELEQKFREDSLFKSSFEGLTPGRQRGYILYFSAPKQSKTRISRIEKSVGKILNGKGIHDDYRMRKKTNK